MSCRSYYKKCVVCGLRAARVSGQKRTFLASFPLDEERCKKWVQAVGIEDLAFVPIERLHSSQGICGKHFLPRDFKKKKTQLKKTAVPSIFLTAKPLPDEILKDFPLHLHTSHAVLHSFPNPEKDPERFEAWRVSVGGQILELTNEHVYKYRRVCHGHFEERFHCRNNRISKIAIPTLNLAGSNLDETELFKVPTGVAKKATKKDEGDDLGEGTSKADDDDDYLLLKCNKEAKKVDDVADDAGDVEDPLLTHDDDEVFEVEELEHKVDKACICCLSVAGDLRDLDGHLREAFGSITGLEIDSEDMPDSICTICIARLTKALAFKSQCTRAYDALTRAIDDTDEDWNSAILTINREELKLNLKLHLTAVLTDEIPPVYTENAEPDDDIVKQENVRCLNDSLDIGVNVDESGSGHFDHSADDAVEQDDSKPVCPEDLDMNDIFKDLKDESASELESLCDVKVENKRKIGEVKVPPVYIGRAKYKKLTNLPSGSNWGKRAALSLSMANIRYLSVPEQKQGHLSRLSARSFLRALFKCAPCVKTFKDRDRLIEHVGFHQRMKEYEHVCDICKCRFERSEELNRHSMMLHWYEFECKQCLTKHRDLSSLINCYTKHKDNPSTVVVPAPSVDQDHHFVKHKLSDSEKLKPIRNPMLEYQCSLCPKAYNDKFNLRKHESLHQPDEKRKLKCDVCGIYLPTKRSVQIHHRMEHLNLYKCRHCSVECSNSMQASAHFEHFHKTEFEAAKKKFTCKTCKAQFDDTGEYKSHVRSHLSHCSVCGHIASSLRALYLHQISNHSHVRLGVAELNDVSAHCAECSVYFADKQTYWIHCAKHHKKLPNDCDTGCHECLKVYSSREELNRHYCVPKEDPDDHDESEYEPPAKQKKALCAHCGLTYTKYRKHMATHDLLKKCKFCKQRNVNAKFMISHILATHTFNPYMCNVCGLRFLKRTGCRDHILKIHTPATPFKCKWCARRFALTEYLNRHIKNEHKNRMGHDDAEQIVPQREAGKLYTFPHMRIDVTLVPPELIKQATFYMSDYSETEYNELGDHDRDQYLYVDHTLDPNVPTRDDAVRITKMKKKTYKYFRMKRLLQYSKARAAEMAVQSIKSTEGDNPASAPEDGTDAVTTKEVILRPMKTFKFEPIPKEVKVGDDVPVHEKVQHDGEEVACVGEEVAHVGEEVAHVGEEVAHVGEEVVQVSEEVVQVSELEMNVDEEGSIGHLVEHDGRKYVLVDGTLYELES